MEAFAAANKEKGFVNHLFMPTTDPSTVFCVWESKAPMTVPEFTAFIDGPEGPSPGTFTNAAYAVMEGGTVPSAAFPVSWLDETMAKIETVLEDFKIEPAIESFTKKIEELTKSISPK